MDRDRRSHTFTHEFNKYNYEFLFKLSQFELDCRASVKWTRSLEVFCGDIRRVVLDGMPESVVDFEYRSSAWRAPMIRDIRNSASTSARRKEAYMPAEIWANILATYVRDSNEDPKKLLERVLENHLCKFPAELVQDKETRAEYERASLQTLSRELKYEKVITLPPAFGEDELAKRFSERSMEYILACKRTLRTSKEITTGAKNNIWQFTMHFRFPNEDRIRRIHVHFNQTIRETYQMKLNRNGSIQATRVYGMLSYVGHIVRQLAIKRAAVIDSARANLAHLSASERLARLQEVRRISEVISTARFMLIYIKDPAALEEGHPKQSPLGGFEAWSDYHSDRFEGFFSR